MKAPSVAQRQLLKNGITDGILSMCSVPVASATNVVGHQKGQLMRSGSSIFHLQEASEAQPTTETYQVFMIQYVEAQGRRENNIEPVSSMLKGSGNRDGFEPDVRGSIKVEGSINGM